MLKTTCFLQLCKVDTSWFFFFCFLATRCIDDRLDIDCKEPSELLVHSLLKGVEVNLCRDWPEGLLGVTELIDANITMSVDP